MADSRSWVGRVFIAASLDGFIARSDGNIDWLTAPAPGPVHHHPHSSAPAVEWEDFFAGVDHLVMGRGTYEKVLTFDDWPSVIRLGRSEEHQQSGHLVSDNRIAKGFLSQHPSCLLHCQG